MEKLVDDIPYPLDGGRFYMRWNAAGRGEPRKVMYAVFQQDRVHRHVSCVVEEMNGETCRVYDVSRRVDRNKRLRVTVPDRAPDYVGSLLECLQRGQSPRG